MLLFEMHSCKETHKAAKTMLTETAAMLDKKKHLGTFRNVYIYWPDNQLIAWMFTNLKERHSVTFPLNLSSPGLPVLPPADSSQRSHLSVMQGQKPLPQPKETQKEARWVDLTCTFSSNHVETLISDQLCIISRHDWNRSSMLRDIFHSVVT